MSAESKLLFKRFLETEKDLFPKKTQEFIDQRKEAAHETIIKDNVYEGLMIEYGLYYDNLLPILSSEQQEWLFELDEISHQIHYVVSHLGYTIGFLDSLQLYRDYIDRKNI